MPAHSPGIHTEQQVMELWASDSAAALNEYLSLFEESEAPRVYLIWGLLTAAAGLLGRNAAFTRGENHIVTPNLFTVLLGPPALKKSTVINQIVGLLSDTTINFGPTDTSGQRQGLMSAMTGLHRPSRFAFRNQTEGPLSNLMLQPRRAQDIFLASPELGRLFGAGSLDMVNFIGDLFDGAQVDYQTKAGETKLDQPLASMLGATTPSSLAAMLPDNAGTHGILSRIIFVHADKLHKSVPLPPVPTPEWEEARAAFKERLALIDEIRTNFTMTKDAEDLYIGALYPYYPILGDPRLEAYRGRRPTLLLKVGMAICALRRAVQIESDDLRLAHELLVMIEPNMHRALEYFGRNRVFQGRMLIVQYLRAQGRSKSASIEELVAAAASELNRREAQEAIESMIASGELFHYAGTYILGEVKNEAIAAREAAKNKGA